MDTILPVIPHVENPAVRDLVLHIQAPLLGIRGFVVDIDPRLQLRDVWSDASRRNGCPTGGALERYVRE